MAADLEARLESAARVIGVSELKDEQRKVLLSFVRGNDVFVSLPTGNGKSVCFAVLPFLFDNIRDTSGSIVLCISPLTSLPQALQATAIVDLPHTLGRVCEKLIIIFIVACYATTFSGYTFPFPQTLLSPARACDYAGPRMCTEGCGSQTMAGWTRRLRQRHVQMQRGLPSLIAKVNTNTGAITYHSSDLLSPAATLVSLHLYRTTSCVPDHTHTLRKCYSQHCSP